MTPTLDSATDNAAPCRPRRTTCTEITASRHDSLVAAQCQDPAPALAGRRPALDRRPRRVWIELRRRGQRAEDRAGEDVLAGRVSSPPRPCQAGRVHAAVVHDRSSRPVKPLTAYKQCCEPHAGVDLIIVRSDDSHVQYDDSDIAADGKITQPVVFPAPGRYRVVVSAYPTQTSPESQNNFQLFTTVTVRGTYQPQPIPPFTATQTRRRLPLPDPGPSPDPRDRSELPHPESPRPPRTQGDLHHLARRARPRDLLPRGLARLLPHPRLQPGRDLLHLGARRDQGDRQLERARRAQRRRPAPGDRDLANVPHHLPERPRPDGALHAQRQLSREREPDDWHSGLERGEQERDAQRFGSATRRPR